MTTVTVRLRARTARALAARAAREGRSLDGLLADLAEQAAAAPDDTAASYEALAALLERAPRLPPEALGRDAIYGTTPSDG